MTRVFPLLALALLCSLFAYRLTSPLPSPRAALIGKHFPEFSTTQLHGGILSQTSLKGHVTVVNVFASWCVPCLAEHPELLELQRVFPDVLIIGIAWKDTPVAVSTFLERHGSPYAAVGMDTRGLLTAPLGITGVPETYVLDMEGVVREKFATPITAAMLAQVLVPLTKAVPAVRP